MIYNYIHVTYILIIHIVAIYGIFDCQYASSYTLLWALLLWPISGLGVTAGVHRLWSHRSYTAHWTVRLWLMLAHSIANQLSIYSWVKNHRAHHKHSKTSADPHNSKRGFWFAHIGHILEYPLPEVTEAIDNINVSDLNEDSIVMIQKSLSPYFQYVMCFFMPAFIANYFWNESFFVALRIAGFLRYVIVLHFTWSVNSFAHLYGNRPYDNNIGATENKIVSIMAIGEGWHNWHHKFPYDYAASEFGVCKQFNPTKLFIDFCALFRLVHNRKRATSSWQKSLHKKIK